jgi:hypothetical protein
MPEKEQATALIRDDVEKSLKRYFSPTDGFTIPEPFIGAQPIANQTHTAVVWEYAGVHTHAFHGIEATQRSVVVRGATIVDQSGETALFHRYIDWSEVMGQLGLAITGRPAVDAPFDT